MSDPTAIPIRLNEKQRQKIAALLRADIAKEERRRANAAAAGRVFVPRPGQRDAALHNIARSRELLAAIESADLHSHVNSRSLAEAHIAEGIADPSDPHRHGRDSDAHYGGLCVHGDVNPQCRLHYGPLAIHWPVAAEA